MTTEQLERLPKEALIQMARQNATTIADQQRKYGEEINRLYADIRDLKAKLAAAEARANIFKASLDEELFERMQDEPRPSLYLEPNLDASDDEVRA